MKYSGILRKLLALSLALVLALSLIACGGEDAPAGDGVAPAGGGDVGDTTGGGADDGGDTSGGGSGEYDENGKPILRIYPDYVVFRTPSGELVAKHYSERAEGETMVESISEDEATLVFYDENGNELGPIEPQIGMTGLTHTDLVTMSSGEFGTYDVPVQLAGCWVIKSGPAYMSYIRIDPDAYVHAIEDGVRRDGMWWQDYSAINRIRICLRGDGANTTKDYIFDFEVTPKTLTLRLVDHSGNASGEPIVYERTALDYSSYTAKPGHEDLPAGKIDPYIHGIWYCGDPYLDFQKLPYKLNFTPSYEGEHVVSFIRANISDSWTYAWVGEGEILYDNVTYKFEIIDDDTMKISRQYFQGSFDEDELGYVEGIYNRISYYSNTTHPYS